MRKVLLGLAGAMALGLGALSAQPAEAQRLTISFGSSYGGGYGGWGGYRGGYWPGHYRRASYPRYYYAPVYRRVSYPVYAAPVYYGPRCVTRVKQRWDGWRYVKVRTRTCR